MLSELYAASLRNIGGERKHEDHLQPLRRKNIQQADGSAGVLYQDHGSLLKQLNIV